MKQIAEGSLQHRANHAFSIGYEPLTNNAPGAQATKPNILRVVLRRVYANPRPAINTPMMQLVAMPLIRNSTWARYDLHCGNAVMRSLAAA
jgi:hypothetical protein